MRSRLVETMLAVAAADVESTSTPGNKDIITPLISVNRLDVEAAGGDGIN